MRKRQLLDIEYSALSDIDKVIRISKQLDLYPEIQLMVNASVDHYNYLKSQLGVDHTPVLILNNDTFSTSIIESKLYDQFRLENDYVINAFDILRRYSN